MFTLASAAKSFVAAVIGLLGVGLTLLDVNPELAAAIVAVASTVFVFSVPNADPS